MSLPQAENIAATLSPERQWPEHATGGCHKRPCRKRPCPLWRLRRSARPREQSAAGPHRIAPESHRKRSVVAFGGNDRRDVLGPADGQVVNGAEQDDEQEH